MPKCSLLGGTWKSFSALLVAFALPAHADLNIAVGGSFDLVGGTMNLGCSDVIVSGTLSLSGGTLSNVRNVVIEPGGALNLGSGSVTLAGDWTNNAGSGFNAGTGSVNFVDDATCATTSTLTGNSTFYRLSIVTGSGKLYRFTSGSTQNVIQQLTLTGNGSPLRIESTVAGSFANINLSGGQSATNLAVRDMSASGQTLAPGQTNQASTGNTTNWFNAPAIPALSNSALAALGLALGAFALVQRRRSRAILSNLQSHRNKR